MSRDTASPVSYTHLDVYKRQDLSKALNCSEVTIRSDIKAMQEEGLLKRIHGGAIRLESVLARNCLLYTSRCV